MKRLFCAVALLAVGMASQQSVAAKKRAPLTPEEQAKREQLRLERFGGIIEKPGSRSGRFAWVNAQKRVPPAMLEVAVKEQNKHFHLDMAVESGEAPGVAGAAAAREKLGANAAVFIIDDPALPSMLVAPESHWAFLNMDAVAKDAGNDEVLGKRVAREMWRVFGLLLGGGDCSYRNCVMAPVSSMADIDAMRVNMFCPDPFNRVRMHLGAIGVRPPVRTSYRKACMEGWAPPPTNEYQRAVFERVKADKERGPTNPIEIKPPAK